MKEAIAQLILRELKNLADAADAPVEISVPKNKSHGDLSTNISLVAAKALGMKPLDLAQQLASRLESHKDWFEKIEIKPPGFLNFFLNSQAYPRALEAWIQSGYVWPDSDRKLKILIEFVSANPTGPMHIGHGRIAVVGDVLSRLLTSVGHEVTREFYLNDHGVQVATLGRSGQHYLSGAPDSELPEGVYRGDYLRDIVSENRAALTPLATDGLALGKAIAREVLKIIQADLRELGVEFDRYFSESSLYENGAITDAIAALKAPGHLYEQDGALWFRTTAFGDDKDRVLVKGDGSYTYFCPDIAYHRDKLLRGFDLYFNAMGADHSGYGLRLKAAVAALGFDPKKLEFLFMQLVNLKRGGAVVSMSKRSGDYVTLRDVLDEVGADATRVFFLLRSHHASLDFDLDLAKSQSADNPVYYLQYAHARICSLFAKSAELKLSTESVSLAALALPEEQELMRRLLEYPEALREAASLREPHRVLFYALDLAKCFQNYYSRGNVDADYRVLAGDPGRIAARLKLLEALRWVLRHSFQILGIAAPERMESQKNS